MEEKGRPQTPVEFFRSISDPQKLQIIRQMVESMEPAFKQEVINTIAGSQAQDGGEVTMQVSVKDQYVRLDFGKALAWFIMPKQHAMQLAMMLLQAAGAQVQHQATPGAGTNGPQPPPIDIEPTKPTEP